VSKVDKGDSFGSRHYLSALTLILGTGKVSQYFKKSEYLDGWGGMCLAVESFVQGDMANSRKQFIHAVADNLGAFEMFAGQLRERENIRIHINQRAPAFIQEFQFVTSNFWQRNLSVREFFENICQEPGFRKAVSEYHLADSAVFGLAFLSKAEQEKIESALLNAKKNLQRFLDTSGEIAI
jgi:hypothetical protein